MTLTNENKEQVTSNKEWSELLSEAPPASNPYLFEQQELLEKRKKYREKNSVAPCIDDWEEETARDHALPCPTGFKYFDEKLHGGLWPGLYVLGGPPGVGKTALSLQIADTVARRDNAPEAVKETGGRDVLFFSWEMTAKQLGARTVSRLVYKQSGRSIADIVIRRGTLRRQLDEYHERKVSQAVAKYKAEIAPNLLIFSDTTRAKYAEENNLESLSRTDYMKAVLKEYNEEMTPEGVGEGGLKKVAPGEGEGGTGWELTPNEVYMQPPLVIVDYFQLLADGDSEDRRGMIDKEASAMKQLSMFYKWPMLLISTLNRESYIQSPNLSSFKESGSIEYTADVALAIEYRDIEGVKTEERWDSFDRERNRTTRRIALKIIKNRFGEGGRSDIDYVPAVHLFSEVIRDMQTDEKQPQPLESEKKAGKKAQGGLFNE